MQKKVIAAAAIATAISTISIFRIIQKKKRSIKRANRRRTSKQIMNRGGGAYCGMGLCRNYYYKKNKSGNISFHSFPKNPDIRKQWISLCKRVDKFNANSSVLCSEHFKPENFKRDLQAELLGYRPKKRLNPDAIPSRNIPYHLDYPHSNAAVRRRKRMEEKKMRTNKITNLQSNGTTEETARASNELKDFEQNEINTDIEVKESSDNDLWTDVSTDVNSEIGEIRSKKKNISRKRISSGLKTINNFVNKLKKMSDEKEEEHEFDVYCKSLAVQLNKMPLQRALICQQKINNAVTEERLSLMIAKDKPALYYTYSRIQKK